MSTGVEDRRVLVIMAKAPQPGRVKTRMTPPLAPERAAALYSSMLTDTVRLARAAAVDVAAMVPASDAVEVAAFLGPGVEVVVQSGRGLADALTAVFETFAARGITRIVAVDSDSPTLPPAQLIQAFDLLDSCEVVLGPTPDGGYYLVGARRPHPELFAPSTTGTPSARQAVQEAAAALGLGCALADEWYDVDTANDLRRLSRDLQDDPDKAPATARLLASWAVDPRLAGLLAEAGA